MSLRFTRRVLYSGIFVASFGLVLFSLYYTPTSETVPVVKQYNREHASLRRQRALKRAERPYVTTWKPGEQKSSGVNKTNKLVLIYSYFYKKRPWLGLNTTHEFIHWHGEPCPVQACELTYNRSRFSESDAVMFHDRGLPDMKTMKELHRMRRPSQRWIHYTIEGPVSSSAFAMLDGMFNWTLSYHRSSDFWAPYGKFRELGPFDRRRDVKLKNFTEGKNGLVAWMVSNCFSSLRNRLVTKLQKYLQVDVYGRCSHIFGKPKVCQRHTDECNDVMDRHKFYLAFENSNCVDYLSEKYWDRAIYHETVPIVMAGRLGDRHDLAIPGSYIDVMDFASVKALADYLLYLDRNSTAYNEYFQWRKRYEAFSHRRNLPNSRPWTCEICAALNSESKPAKVYNRLYEFWKAIGKCGEKNHLVESMLLKG